VIGWEWEGAAAGRAGCGVSDDEDRARKAAEAWLNANPQGTAVLSAAWLADGATTLSAYWARTGRARRSQRLEDGRIVWARIPVSRPGGGG
jgi:ABC-type sugar transport system substrate-binding protein